MSFKKFLSVLVVALLLVTALLITGCEEKDPVEPPATDDGKATYTISGLLYKKNADGYRVVVDSPRAIEKRIRLADGSVLKTNDEHIEYTL